MYGLPKINRQNCPLRPVSLMYSPTYFMSKLFNNIPKKINLPKSNVRSYQIFQKTIVEEKLRMILLWFHQILCHFLLMFH